ncbi:MAG: Gfo/Idh/MocA family protein [Saccharofermentanales bacterium]
MDGVRWGIIGSGKIAHRFASDVKLVENAKLIACSSKDEKKALSFKEKYNLEFSYGNYEDMVRNPLIDAVYIATTHNFHHDNAMLCLRYGKHVLCEKAFTINAIQAREIFKIAKENNLFMMEAMWSRFLPAVIWAKKQIQNGEIGKPLSINAQFGVKFPYDPKSRAFNIDLAGGGLLDVGIYPLSLICNILGNEPVKVGGVAKIGQTGVDEQASVSLLFDEGQMGTFAYSMLTELDNTFTIHGTSGKITLNHVAFPTSAKLIKENSHRMEFDNLESNGFEHEIREATSQIILGNTTSKVISPEDTIKILGICDELRKKWNFKYPSE